MNLISVIRDPRRRQRGSVLSGVLIITACLAIISGALMTELSTNLLLSRDIMKRVATEATVSSSIELAIDNIQTAPLTTACPTLNPPPPMNGLNASVAYISCALVTDSIPEATSIASSEPFTIDGSYISLPGVLPGAGQEYLLADSGGALFGFRFGGVGAWTVPLGGTPTAPPTAMSAGNGAIADLVPISYAQSNNAVALVTEATPGQPSLKCNLMPNPSAPVISAPGPGRNIPNVVYFGDQSGRLYAFDTSASGSCGLLDQTTVGSQPIVAGPVVFPGSTPTRDRLFLIVSNGNSSTLEEYRFSSTDRDLTLAGSWPLPAANAVGMVSDATSIAAGGYARLAITFAGGQLAIAEVSSSFMVTLLPQTGSLPVGGVTKPPAWCQTCLGTGVIGVGSPGGLYLFDSNLNLYESFTGMAITTAPAADAGGDWFVGDTSGVISELRPLGQGGMVVAHAFPVSSATISSSPIVQGCTAGLCVYFGANNSHAYLISLDQRDLVLSASACISAQGVCTSVRPELWAHVVVGGAGNPQTARMAGFSYYSP